jgi:site-specific DNA-methyltransferase (adenine-specific)
MTGLPRNTILTGDALVRLRELPAASVDCAITSPPYYQLRNYGTAGQLGLDESVDGWVAQLRAVCRELARVLKPTGSLWLNLGDSYSRHPRYGAPPKSFLLGPERLALALVQDGWIVRNKVIWAKTNPMPNSVTDRLNATYEVVYFLVRSQRYYFDLDAIREPHRSTSGRSARSAPLVPPAWAGPLAGRNDGLLRARAAGQPGHRLGRNPGDVWQLATRGYRGAHFATFPEALVRRPLLATCPQVVCTVCGQPWRWRHATRTVGELVPCGCDAPTRPGIALDPFFGTGTVGVVARQLGRDWLGIELNPAYVAMAWQRLGRQAPKRYERAAPLAVAA